MVVVRGEPEVGERFVGVARAPECVHHLDVQLVVAGDAEGLFCGADSLESRFRIPNIYPFCLPLSHFVYLQGRETYLECVRVIARPHRRDLVGVLDRLVDDLEHAHVAEGVILVDVGCHPLKELERSFILIVHVEAGGRGILVE